MKLFKSIIFMVLGTFGVLLGLILGLTIAISLVLVIQQQIMLIPAINFQFIMGSIFVLTIVCAIGFYIFKSPAIIREGLSSFKEWIRKDSE